METIMEKPVKFKARKQKLPNGKDMLVIDPITEEIDRGNGRVDVVVHVPSLALIKEFKIAHGIE